MLSLCVSVGRWGAFLIDVVKDQTTKMRQLTTHKRIIAPKDHVENPAIMALILMLLPNYLGSYRRAHGVGTLKAMHNMTSVQLGVQAARVRAAVAFQALYRSYRARRKLDDSTRGPIWLRMMEFRAAIRIQRAWRWRGVRYRLAFVTTLNAYCKSINTRVLFVEERAYVVRICAHSTLLK